jgi:hypothetical protein
LRSKFVQIKSKQRSALYGMKAEVLLYGPVHIFCEKCFIVVGFIHPLFYFNMLTKQQKTPALKKSAQSA